MRKSRELLFQVGLVLLAIVLGRLLDSPFGYIAAGLLAIAFIVQWILQREELGNAEQTSLLEAVTPSGIKEPRASNGKIPDKATGPPITLKQLFEIDWPNFAAYYNECILSSQIFEAGSVKVAWRVNGDFVGRSKFLAILVDPTAKVSDAFKACEAIADRYGRFIDSTNLEVDIQGQAPDDTAPTHPRDMVFSKRIFIYYEDFSLAQKGALETIYQSKELSVQFRDAAYTWAHRDEKPRDTPLVPNSTLLPAAHLNPGLRITVTKLSPGPGAKLLS